MKLIKSLFTDRDWDADISKLVGFILVALGCYGFLVNKDSQWILALGVSLLGIAKVREG
jgi:hypothetical protein